MEGRKNLEKGVSFPQSTIDNRQPSQVMINALPKSGTHLLAKAVELFGYREHFAGEEIDNPERITPIFFNYREVKNALAKIQAADTEDTDETVCVGTLTPCYVGLSVFRHWLEAMPKGRYILGHVAWTPALAPVFAELDYRHLFIIRDPRAVVASLISFILDTGRMPRRHFLEADFKVMTSMQRLNFLLEGGSAPTAEVEVRGFADVYRSMLAWQDEASCLFVRFEELVGEPGGGSADKQRDVVKKIAKTLGASFDDIAPRLTEIYDPSSRTFRTGKIDGWKDSMDAESLERLTAYCEPLCAEAGYEL